MALKIISLFLVCTMLARGESAFVNWETAPVRPLALSPDRKVLAVANLPAARLELINVMGTVPEPMDSIPVGLDPVTVRYRNADEVWIVCRISDAINIVRLSERRVESIVPTADEPSDVVFAGKPLRAYVSCSAEDLIQVFDPDTHTLVDTIPIKGERPQSLAMSPDGLEVYVGIFESGNASTILAPRFGGGFVPGSVVDFHDGPYQGANPPPNSGDAFSPPLGEHGQSPPPRVGLIVKKTPEGQWLDDNSTDWSEFVSGNKAPLSGRPSGWDMPDRDLAIIQTRDHSIEYLSRLMNICMDVAVNPATGQISVIGTDATNEIRFEPVLNGRFLTVEHALVDPVSGSVERINLNPHLEGLSPPFPTDLTTRSIGDPRQILWSPEGHRAYVAGMGSDNLLVLDASGAPTESIPIPLEGGPTALALDPEAERLFVYQRFANQLTVINTQTLEPQSSIRLFDPTPSDIRQGRVHFYNTQKTSGSGHVSCASCHVNGRFDRLAWDLGTPEGPEIPINRTRSFETEFQPSNPLTFHPMKGPMVTMTMQDLIGHEPFHWRGDRFGIEAFNATFTDLQARDTPLLPDEMAEFKAFLASLHFPPNRYRTFSNALSPEVSLQDQFSLGRDANGLPAGSPYGTGNALRGQDLFRGEATCSTCHTLSTGLGTHMRFSQGHWKEIPRGPHGERFVSLVEQPRTNELPFKIASLRALSEKVGTSFSNRESPTGFGFSHNGAVDSLTRFLQDGFDFVEDQSTADLIAFLLSFTGSEIDLGHPQAQARPPGLLSQDTHAAVGAQFLANAGNRDAPTLRRNLGLTQSDDDPVDPVAFEHREQERIGWLYDPGIGVFVSDGPEPAQTFDELIDGMGGKPMILFMFVPPGTGTRLALDWDADRIPNRIEMRSGFNPYSPSSTPENLPPQFQPNRPLVVAPGERIEIEVKARDGNDPPDPLTLRLIGASPRDATMTETHRIEWTAPSHARDEPWVFEVEARDHRHPPVRALARYPVFVIEGQPSASLISLTVEEDRVKTQWRVRPGRYYQVRFAEHLGAVSWVALTAPFLADQTIWEVTDLEATHQSRFYRIELIAE